MSRAAPHRSATAMLTQRCGESALFAARFEDIQRFSCSSLSAASCPLRRPFAFRFTQRQAVRSFQPCRFEAQDCSAHA